MLVVFDWDGTVIDSAAKIVGSMQRAAHSCSLLPQTDEAIRNIIGLSLPEAVRRLYPQEELAVRERLQQAYSREYIEADRIPCSLFAGVGETLELLLQQGHHIAVATGKSRRGLDRVLSNMQWQDKFHATRCADETASKPDPLMLQQLMHELNIPQQETFMVGDTEYDLEMAVKAGVRGIGVSYGAHAAERLHRYQPLAVVDNMLSILDLIHEQ